MAMRVDLRYGDGFLPLELDSDLSIEQLVPKTVTKHPNALSELLRVQESPIDSPPLSERVSEVDSIAIVVNRFEHHKLIEDFLLSLLSSVETFAFDPDDISIIYPVLPGEQIMKDEVDDLLGNPEGRGHMLVLHRPEKEADLSHIGETPSYSTPVYVNEAFLCADLKIGLGEIRPDVFYGATGGRMSVIPNVSGIRTINRNAKLKVGKTIGQFMMETPSCIDMLEIAQIAGLDFIINTVLDWQGNLAQVVAGDSRSAWKSGIESAFHLASADYTKKADIVVVSAGGKPLDNTLYDAIDSLYPALEVTEHGASIVLVAECSDDVAPEGFLRGMSEHSSEEEVLIASDTGFELGMEKAYFFWNVLNSRNVIICSRLRESLVEERLHCTAVKDLQEGLEVAQSMLASSKKIAILNDGLRTTPRLRNP
jgi:nickel-dependent lactate racemase